MGWLVNMSHPFPMTAHPRSNGSTSNKLSRECISSLPQLGLLMPTNCIINHPLNIQMHIYIMILIICMVQNYMVVFWIIFQVYQSTIDNNISSFSPASPLTYLLPVVQSMVISWPKLATRGYSTLIISVNSTNEEYWALGMGTIGHLEVILCNFLQITAPTGDCYDRMSISQWILGVRKSYDMWNSPQT